MKSALFLLLYVFTRPWHSPRVAGIRLVETAAVAAERDCMAVLAGLPVAALYALAAREFAAKLERADSLTVSPDMISDLINQVRALTAAGGQSDQPAAAGGSGHPGNRIAGSDGAA